MGPNKQKWHCAEERYRRRERRMGRLFTFEKKNRFQIMGQLITMSQVGGQVLLSGPFNVPQLCLDRWRLQNHCAQWLLR